MRFRGRTAEVVTVDPTATGRSVAAANLDLVVRACESANIDYFLVPEPGVLTYRVGVPSSQWSAFASALTESSCSVTVRRKVRGETRTVSVRSDEPDVAGAIGKRQRTSVFAPVSLDDAGVPGRTYGLEWACLVERWTEEDGRLVAPSRNPRAAWIDSALAVPASVEVGARSVRTLAPLARPHVLDVRFPIDVVYLWVDGDDPQWRARKNAALADAGIAREPEAVADARFRDGGELKYSLRSLAQYAPWVRRVFLVTDRQVPSWLNLAEPRLTVVDHEQLFAGAGTLPTFNSHAIGARLHHIEGLSEQFLYANDDMFFGRDTVPQSFFFAGGQSKFFLSKLALGLTGGELPSHEGARRNVIELIERDFGTVPAQIFYHSPYPQRRSVMFELEGRYPREFERTLHNQFRSDTDVEPNTWLYSYYAFLTGAAVPGEIPYTYVQLGRAGAEERLVQLAAERDRDVFCINDHADATPEQHAFAMDWLASYFAVPSPFEL